MSNMLFTFKDWAIANDSALPKGGGLFSATHIAMIVLMVVWIVGTFILFAKYRNLALKIVTFCCYFMMFSRSFRMIFEIVVGTNTVIEMMPWHLCHVMAFVFPIFYLTHTKKFFTPIVIVTFFGGVLTFLFGNYYVYKIFTFFDIESLLLHFMMFTVVVGVVATRYITIELKNLWQCVVVLALVVANASLGNYLCPNKNFLFLKENGLPFNLFPGHSHLYTYAILVLVITILVVSPILIIKLIKRKKSYKYEVIG